MKTVQVSVKQKHIDAGEPGSCFHCALTLAIREATGVDEVATYSATCRVGDLLVKLPDTAVQFREDFDSDWRFSKPLTFKLELPEE